MKDDFVPRAYKKNNDTQCHIKFFSVGPCRFTRSSGRSSNGLKYCFSSDANPENPAGALQDIGLPQNEIPLALAIFNIGAELGQILFVLVALVLLSIIRSVLPTKNWTEKHPPYAIGTLAVFWLIDRIAGF